MKRKRRIAMLTAVTILAMPLVFVAVTQRTDSGAISTYTLRFTQFRIFLSNSGNACFARQEMSAPPDQIVWSVTRRNRVTWVVVNATMLYLDLPRVLT